MRGTSIAAGLVLATAWVLPAAAGYNDSFDSFDGFDRVPSSSLGNQHAGPAYTPATPSPTQQTNSNSTLQTNTASNEGSNSGNISVGSGSKSNGQISAATVIGNSGLVTLMQNTGDLVNMNNATNVNVYIR